MSKALCVARGRCRIMTVASDHLRVAVAVLRLRIGCVLGVWGRVGAYGPGCSLQLHVTIMSLSYVLDERNACQHRSK